MTCIEVERPQELIEAKEDRELCHRICTCNEDLAICGRDVAGDVLYEYDEDSPDPDCPECVTLTPFWLCARCGKAWDEE